MADQWQTPDTAPKDGSEFIAAFINTRGEIVSISTVRWLTAEQIADAENGDPADFTDDWDDHGDEAAFNYWTPMPAIAGSNP